MSVRAADLAYTAASLAALKRRPEPAKGRNGVGSFSEALIDASGTPASADEQGTLPVKAAELLQLQLMRSALSLDTASAPTLPESGRLEELLEIVRREGGRAASTASDKVPENALEEAAPSAMTTSATVTAGPYLETVINRASRRYGVDSGLIKAVIRVESGFNPRAVSSAGAQGLMQLMPATAAGLGITDPFNPEQNVMAGTRFLKDMLNRYGGNLDKALAAYNWGPGNLDRGRGRLPQETQDYLVKVKKSYADYRTG